MNQLNSFKLMLINVMILPKKNDVSTVPNFYFYTDGELSIKIPSVSADAIEAAINAHAQEE